MRRVPCDAPPGEDPALAWIGPVEERSDAPRPVMIHGAPPVCGDTDDDADVLADWQQEQADPHLRALGELAHLPPHDPRARELLAEHADVWLGGHLAMAWVGFRRGFVDSVVVHTYGDHDERHTGHDELAAAFALPIAARLRRIVVEYTGPRDLRGNSYLDSTPVLGALAGARGLREVELVGLTVDSLAPLAALPALDRLVARLLFCRRGYDGLAHATLRSLELVDNAAAPDGLPLSAAQLPRLRRLVYVVSRETCARNMWTVLAAPLVAGLEELDVGGDDPDSQDMIMFGGDRAKLAHIKRWRFV